jgi:signal transduction histidine kinase
MNLARILQGIIALCILAALLTGSLLVLNGLSESDALTRLSENDEPAAQSGYELEINAHGLAYAAIGYAIKPLPEHEKRIDKDIDDFERFAAQLRRINPDPETMRALERTVERFNMMKMLAYKMKKRSDMLQRQLANAEQRQLNQLIDDSSLDQDIQQMVKLREEIDDILDDELQPLVRERLLRTLDERNTAFRNALWFSIGSAVLLTIFALFLLLMIQKHFITPLRRIGQVVHAAGQGHLDERTDLSGSTEIARLSRNLDHALNQLQNNMLAVDQLSSVLNQVADYVLIINDSGRIEFASEQTARKLGYSSIGLSNLPIQNLFLQTSEPVFSKPRRHLQQSTSLLTDIIDKQGQRKPVRLLATRISESAHSRFRYAYLAQLIDDDEDNKTELRRLTESVQQTQQALLKELSERQRLEQQLLVISEHEQAWIGQNLHDSLGQRLTGASLLSKALAEKLQEGQSDEARQAKDIAKLINNCIDEVRYFSRGLNPLHLEANDLVQALQQLCNEIRQIHGIDCVCDVSTSSLTIGTDLANQLFRISQEAISNALRHGKASEIVLTLSQKADRVRLAVYDNGVGIKIAVNQNQGLGLRGMQLRTRYIGGRMRLRSRAGSTIVLINAPLHIFNASQQSHDSANDTTSHH